MSLREVGKEWLDRKKIWRGEWSGECGRVLSFRGFCSFCVGSYIVSGVAGGGFWWYGES